VPSSRWSQDEINASVKAYLGMLGKEIAGVNYNKAAVNRELRGTDSEPGPLHGRSKTAVENRMSNISAVLVNQHKRRIRGYVPLSHVGPGPTGMIESALKANQELLPSDVNEYFEPTGDDETLENRVNEIRENVDLGLPPGGNRNPRRHPVAATEVPERDPNVKRWVLDTAEGICELCGEQSPFRSRRPGNPWYLEVHHVVPLGPPHDGPDTTCNAVALCPNCHAECHYSEKHEESTRRLYQTINRLVE